MLSKWGVISRVICEYFEALVNTKIYKKIRVGKDDFKPNFNRRYSVRCY